MRIYVVQAIAALTIALGINLAGSPVHAQEAATPVPYEPSIDPANFKSIVDNPWFPLVPGSVWVYDGEGDDGPEHNEVTVTNDTKVIMGVTCIVVHDVVYSDDEVVEDTLDYFAQDIDGNVWYFGEDSSEVENGSVVSTEGSWLAGEDGAYPGLQMLTSPQVSLQYRQEYLAGEAEDMAAILDLNGSASVPFGDFEPVLLVKEWSPFEPGVVENKAYAQGIGMVQEKTVQGGNESMTLTSYTSGESSTPTS